MKIAKPGLDLIKDFEKCRLEAYLPTSHDVPTIGWGSTGTDIHLGMVWTQEQADARFVQDLGRFEYAVEATIGTAPTTQNQFDALVSLTYNIGGPGFHGSTVARKHISGDHIGAAHAFSMWNKQAGVVLDGLTRRRAQEAALYLGN